MASSRSLRGSRGARGRRGGRIAYLTADDEAALQAQLAPHLRPLFTFSLHTGLRWSEQAAVRWADVDLLAGIITIGRSKNGHTRRVPINSTVARLLVDLGASRTVHSDAEEPVFRGAAYRTVSRAFLSAVERAQAALRDAVDLLTVQTLGGWRTPSMVQRYAHLAPEHLASAVERLVSPAVVELGRNLNAATRSEVASSTTVA